MIQYVFSYSLLLLCEILLVYCFTQRGWAKRMAGEVRPDFSRPYGKPTALPPRLDKSKRPFGDESACVYESTNAPPLPFYGKNRAPIFRLFHTERTPAAVCPPSCNSPASRHGAFAPRLPPTFSGLASQWLTFVTQLALFRCILAPTVPFAWGFYPVLSKPPPDKTPLR